jgi:hypothetical protein
MTDLLALLDRQYGQLEVAEGPEFLLELKRYRQLIDDEPRLAAILDVCRREAAAARERFVAHDEALMLELAALKAELLSRAPDLADPNTARPRDRHGVPSMDWIYSFTNFDEVVARSQRAFYVRDQDDDSGAGLLLRILEERLRNAQWYGPPKPPEQVMQTMAASETNLRPELDDLSLKLGNLADRHRHELSAYQQAKATMGGFAVDFIDSVLAQANPPPRDLKDQDDWHRHVGEQFRRFAAGLMAVEPAMRPAGQRNLSPQETKMVELLVEKLRPQVRACHEDVRLRFARSAEPPPNYGVRLQRWVTSAPGVLFVAPLTGQAVVQAVKGDRNGLVLIAVLSAMAAFVPPAIRAYRVPPLRLSWLTGAFVLIATALAVTATATAGVGAGLLVVAAAITAFALGLKAGAERV